MPSKRAEHTFVITVSAPRGLPRRAVAREVRTLINEQCNWGHEYIPAGKNKTYFDSECVEDGDIKVRKIGRPR